MLFVACQDNAGEDVDSGKTSLSFEATTIELDGKAGSYAVAYTLKNGIEGIDIAIKCDTDWLTNLRTESGKIHFDYTQNLGKESRTAAIMVTYPNVKSVLIKITQRVNDSVTFTMEVTSQTTASCTTKITPSDPEAIYIVYMSELIYLQSAEIDSAEKLFLDDYNYFMGFAQQVNAPKLKEFFLANYFAYQGEQNITWDGMMPNNEYVLYVYAVEFNAENNDYSLASPITYQIITLDNPERTTVEFDVQIDVNGPTAEYNITPIDYDGKYYFTIYEEGDYMYRNANTPVDDTYAELVADVWVDMVYTLLISGYSADQLLELMCLSGNVEYGETLKGSTNYALVIYAIDNVDGIPQVVSNPQVFNFRTEEIGASDMTIDIKVENKYVRVADVTITPSTNEPYTAAIIAKSSVPELENSELIEWLNTNLQMESYSGYIYNHINTFEPETEYSVFAYGYWGDVVTTDLFRYDFKMDAESECENSVVRVDFSGPYSLMELESYNPDYYYSYGMFESMGWYGMWGEIFTEQPTQDLFYCIYAADKLVTGGTDAIFADLVSYTCKKTSMFTGQNDKLYVMCAVAMDYRGNYSEMWMSEPFSYHYDESTKRPLNELIEKIHGTPTTQRQEVKNAGITNHLAK
jgi:hypothetical protein